MNAYGCIQGKPNLVSEPKLVRGPNLILGLNLILGPNLILGLYHRLLILAATLV